MPAASAPAGAKKDTPNHFEWADFAAQLPTGKDEASRKQRKKIFDTCDVNANGVLSLAEFDRGLREVFGHDFELRVFKAKPAIMRAFQAAKKWNKSKGKKSKIPFGLNGDDYVDKSEFRVLLMYLRQYFEVYVMFEDIDGGNIGDDRITLKEFVAAARKLRSWGVDVTEANAPSHFDKIDVDKNGYVRFDEFAAWALANKLDLEDDDDADEDDFVLPANNLASADGERRRSMKDHQRLMHTHVRSLARPAARARGRRRARTTGGRRGMHACIDRWPRPFTGALADAASGG